MRSMETEKLPLRQAFFGLIFAALFVVAGAIAVSASYGNEGGDPYGTGHSEDGDHSEKDDDHSEDGESHDEDGEDGDS